MEITLARQSQKKKWLMGAIFVSLIGYAAVAVSSKSAKSIPLSSIAFQSVSTGALDVYASSYGELASAKERLLTAPAQGKVSEILVRPGTLVKPETIILQLTNPKLEQEVSEAQGELAQLQAQREAFKYEQQNDRLNYQSTIANIEAELEKAKLELSVNQNLMDLGVAAKIELQRAELAVKQQTKRLEFEQQKYQQFLEMQNYQLTQRDITIKQQSSQVALLEKQLSDMHVTAGIHGSLQTLDIELGESVSLGQSLAKVGSNTELLARLRIPQHQADQIDINAPVLIDTQKGQLKARISRIESIVTNGSILAEALIEDELTSNARPALAISAQVFIKHDDKAMYIEQTSGLRPRSTNTVFVRTSENELVQQTVSFGELSQGKLLINNGLEEGQSIVSTDMSSFTQYQHLLIEQ
ncbi:efflux RND transporter periplasmic adaptor subunit [Thalassotalea fusca]